MVLEQPWEKSFWCILLGPFWPQFVWALCAALVGPSAPGCWGLGDGNHKKWGGAGGLGALGIGF